MGRSLHWTILCLRGALSGSSLSVGLYALDLWDTMGHARLCGKLGVLLEFWVGKI